MINMINASWLQMLADCFPGLPVSPLELPDAERQEMIRVIMADWHAIQMGEVAGIKVGTPTGEEA